jgi:hypothetical protein
MVSLYTPYVVLLSRLANGIAAVVVGSLVDPITSGGGLQTVISPLFMAGEARYDGICVPAQSVFFL